MVPAAIKFLLNRTGLEGLRKLELGTEVVEKKKHIVKAVYDFSKVGGAIGAISLLGSDGKAIKVPANAIVTNVLVDVKTALTSGGSATVAIAVESAADLLAATAVASFSLAALLAGKPVGTAATAVKTTVERSVVATVAVAALTAGKMNVLVEYVLSE